MVEVKGYHINLDCIADSDGRIHSLDKEGRLQFLLDGDSAIKVFYDLDYSVACLLRAMQLTKADCQKFLSEKKYHTAPYMLGYVQGKFFSVKGGFYFDAPFANFSDMSQYEPNFKILPGDEPIAKAREAKVIGEKVLLVLQSLGLNPTSLTSPIRAFEKEVLSKLDLPTIDDLPPEAAEYAYSGCHGGWVEIFQKGHFEQVYDYDLTSAYPYFVSRLLDTRFGSWVQSKEYQAEATYGWCKGIVTNEAELSPIIFTKTAELNYSPVGTWEAKLSKAKIDFLYRHKLGKFKIENGWWFFKNNKTYKTMPLNSLMAWLFNRKSHAEGLERLITKRIQSGIWGKLLEIRKDKNGTPIFGEHFNPCWGEQVESETQIAVAEFCINNGIMPLSVAVDGVISPVPIALPQSNGMGKWRLSYHNPALLISSGIVAIRGKEGEGDFALNYDWLMSRIKDNPQASTYEMTKLSHITLPKALAQDKFDKLGEFEQVTKTVDITYETKRNYKDKPNTGAELLKNKYQSAPWDITIIRGLI